MRLLESVIKVNEEQPRKVVALLEKHWANLTGIRVAVLGLAFKPGTNDVRESPAFPILRELLKRGAVLKAFDPVAMDEARRIIGDASITYCESLSEALLDIDALIVVTPWPEFREVPALLRGRHPAPVFVDVRRAFERGSVERYEGIGL
jgi:UDPglucose 6-dehydrogenase/GDP-mannose 6-dehydrogenase